ncbi:GspH/FimT family protein [Spiribacter onubensis]|uniref:Type II secretion system protein H n=1 Tax=Spiribacter onubensis TaxID=3122420 RepID=A0ABV3S5Z2_9GAMM
MRRQEGVSLPGLMLTLTLTAILTTLAAPVFSGIAADARLQNGAERLYTAFWYARSEAIMRGRTVVVAALDGDWESGWQVFVDTSRDGRRQHGEALLRRSEGPDQRIAVEANAGIGSAVHYQPDGRTRRPSGSLQMGTVVLCHGAAEDPDRRGQGVIINAAGRPRITGDPQRMDDGRC